MQKDRVSPQYFMWTLWLVLALCACFLFTTMFLHNQARDACYEQIERITQDAAYNLQYTMEINRFQLEIIEDMLPEDLTEDKAAIAATLDTLCEERILESLCIQLPDNSVIQGQNWPLPDFGGLHRFDHDAQKAPYISDICKAAENWYIYQAIPILRQGETVGILYGFFNLSSMPSFFASVSGYDGQTYLYLVEGTSGDFMMDTWPGHGGALGNITAMGGRETKPGYSQEAMWEDIRSGREGYFVFRSRSTGDWLYTHYRPAGINNWSIQVTVEESVAFAQVQKTNALIGLLASVVLVLIAIYVIWVAYKQRLLSRKSSQQLQHSDNMYQVQQILFDAYEKPERIGHSMEKIARIYGAEGAFLLTLKGSFIHNSYAWTAAESALARNTQGKNILRDFPGLHRQLQSEKSVFYSGTELLPEESAILRQRGVQNMLAVPLKDSEGTVRGVLFVLNASVKPVSPQFLESVAPDFVRALQGMDSYRVLHNMGRIDSLTGLKNRNVFDASLTQYANMPCHLLYSIYIDVNGLHEVNNLYGHSAGDTMLRTVAAQIRGSFGEEHTYRIGGDEFAVFAMDLDEEDLQKEIRGLKEAVRENDYHISVGYACQESDFLNIDDLMATAEERMYRDKQEFYQQHGPEKARQRNTRLEKLIQEKQDVDNFLDLISSHYMGIYVINLEKDVARTLYNPGYFGELLERYHYRYIATIIQYAQDYVADADRDSFLEFCNYGRITDLIGAGIMPKLFYRKADGTRVCLRVFPSRNYREDKEIFWFFEKLSEE